MEAKYDRIGKTYNHTRKADPYLASRMHALLVAHPDHQCLEVGCGTGNYTHALAQKGLNLIAIDPSETMLNAARQRESDIQWRKGSADKTGLQDLSIDRVLASLTIHHWPSLSNGFKEIARVLKPDGRLVMFTSTPFQMEGYWLCHFFPEAMNKACRQMPSMEAVKTALSDAGMSIIETEKYFVEDDLQDLFLLSGKRQPELYFRKDIRNGISTFADLANREEVERGLEKLRAAIDSGEIADIITSFDNDRGDYLYIVAEKVLN